MKPIDSADAFPVMLREAALVWFEELDDETKQDWPAIQERFLTRFCHPTHVQWADSSDVWHCEQQPNQSVDNYLNLMQKKITRVNNLPIVSQVHAVLSGLRPEIRMHFVQHTCDTIEDIRRWGLVAERSIPPPATSNNDVMTALKEVQEKLKILTTQTVAAIAPPSLERSQQQQQYQQVQQQQAAMYRQQPYRNQRPRQFNNSGPRGQNSFAPRNYGMQPPQVPPFQYAGPAGPQQQPMYQQPPTSMYQPTPTPQAPPQNYGVNNAACQACGSIHRFNFCPAVGRQCLRCQGFDHFAKVCTFVAYPRV